MHIYALCWAFVVVALLTEFWAPADGSRLFVVQGKSFPQVSLSSSVLLQLHLHEGIGILPVWFPWSLQGSEVLPAPELTCAVCRVWVKVFIHSQWLLWAWNSLSCALVSAQFGSPATKLLLELVFHLLKNSHIDYLTLCRVLFPVVKIFSTVQY